MRLLCLLTLACLVSSLIFPLGLRAAESSVFDPAELKVGQVKWILPLKELSPGGKTEWGKIDGQDLFVLDTKNVLHCIDLDKGTHKWIVMLDGSPSYAPTVSSDAIGVVIKDRVVIVRRSSGSRVLDRQIEFTPCTPLVANRDVGYAGCLYKEKLHAIDTGRGLTGWTFRFADIMSTAPVLAGSGSDLFLYATTHAGTVACFDPQLASEPGPRKPEWKHQTGGRITADPFVDGDLLFVAGEDRSLYAFGRLSGTLRWRYMGDVALKDSPLVAGGKVFLTEGNDTVCLDRATGKQLWRAESYNIPAGIVKNIAYLMSDEGKLAMINAESGKEIRIVEPNGVVGVIGNPNAGMLVFTDGAKIHAFK